MRKISAHLILDGKGKCYTKGILTLDADGTILEINDTNGILNESAEVEFYSGVVVPGFINAHCHLELSHLQDKFSKGAGFVPFLKQVLENRVSEPEKILKAAERADLLMYKNGIIAVGDIANNTSAFDIKRSSKIDYFTFIETLGFAPSRAEKAFNWAKDSLKVAESFGFKASIVPHASYSISIPLFKAVADEAIRTGSILSIHNQESSEEDDLFRSGSGDLVSHLADNLGIDISFFSPTGEGSLRSILKFLPLQNNLLLIHNLFTNQSDIDYIGSIRNLCTTWFVLCPCSNLYIQNRLPDIDLFRNNHLRICLGTDSLASNHQLSILEEMKTIQAAHPDISIDELLTWACFNGASALKIDDWAGSIEVGKRPGINLLSGIDLERKKFLPGTRVRKLI